jgi:hypothetical protein
MEVIKRKISFEPATVRYTGGTSPYGTMTANTFYIKIMLTQNSDDMGILTDIKFEEQDVNGSVPDYTSLTNKLSLSGFSFPFMSGTQPATPSENPVNTTGVRVTGKELEDYWAYASKITGYTDTKINDVKSYNKTNPYITGFDVDKTTYTNYVGTIIDGKTRITEQTSGSTTYVFDANNDVNIGTPNQSSGILYNDSNLGARVVVDEFGGEFEIPYTKMEYTGEGWNQTNTSLSAVTKEEYLFGITQRPEVFSDVFIDRGDTTVFEKHLRLSEVESLEHLERYNNGFYRLVKQ